MDMVITVTTGGDLSRPQETADQEGGSVWRLQAVLPFLWVGGRHKWFGLLEKLRACVLSVLNEPFNFIMPAGTTTGMTAWEITRTPRKTWCHTLPLRAFISGRIGTANVEQSHLYRARSAHTFHVAGWASMSILLIYSKMPRSMLVS
jgi:hypothetical protein